MFKLYKTSLSRFDFVVVKADIVPLWLYNPKNPQPERSVVVCLQFLLVSQVKKALSWVFKEYRNVVSVVANIVNPHVENSSAITRKNVISGV